MEAVKRLFISLLVLLGCSAGAWAIEQDADGYYLIGSVQDWKDFAALVQTTPTANAKMTADVDLGDDQTRIGDVAGNEYGAKFGGIFDGQGHTLTVAYNITGQNMCAPFTKTNGATIKNLHVAGTMRTEFCHLAGIIADAYGTNTIENVWVSADLTSANNYNSGGRILDLCGAFVGCKKTGTLSISNGLFSGSITTENGSIWNGAFLGYIDGENQSSATITNCLSVGTFSYIEHETTIPNRGTNTYCYVKQFPTTIPSEMQVTDEQLADGTIASALGDGWAQDPLTHQPVPKIFTTVQDEDGYYLIGSVQDWKRFADIVNSGTNTAANAKMTADVDLGDDQTYISPDWHGEFSNLHYHGTFDGQGHTLTVHYNSDKYFHTPFSQTSGATIKNLHVAGTIKSTSSGPSHMSGLISNSAGNDVIQNVWVSADITGGSNSWIECGAFIGCNNCGNTTITDCLFTGSITTTGGNNGCFAGWVQSYNPSSITTTNCLSIGTFNIGSGSVSRGTLNNCYVKSYPYSIPSTMQVTDEQLANGTTAAALQAGRTDEIWVQDPVLGIPMLKIFATVQDEDGYYLIGSVQDWKRFADIVNSGTNPAANAKMIADVDLGDDQTTIGICAVKHSEDSRNKPFCGIFDGQGHTLTINYTSESSGSTYVAVFPYARGLTIKNLHIDGSVTVTNGSTSGIISFHRGEGNVMENVWSSLNITSTETNWSCSAAFVGSSWQNGQPNYLVVKDCLFTGSLNDPQGDYDGCFLGWIESGSATFENCLTLGFFSLGSSSAISKGSNMTMTNCYIKQFPQTISENMRITDEQISDGTLTTNLQNNRDEEIWVQDPELGIPMLKIFAKTEEDNPVTDLSATTTANTYIISAAGKYKFKATVKGNGGLDPLTGTIATPIDPASIAGVKVLWELGDTYGRTIKYENGAYDISYSDGYVYFSTPIYFTTGVTCVAIYDSSDNILWSWDLWSTPEPGTVTYNGNTFMDRNLCAVDINNNRGFLYQWGRKDAFSAATGSYASFTFVPALGTAFNTVRGIQTIDYCIKHPTTHVNNGDENSWMSREEYNTLPWRDDVKTIYDPCPAGWRVPTAAEQNGYSGLPGTGFSNAINEFGNPGSGYYRSSTISSYPRAYAFRQSGQQNNWGTNPAMAIRPVMENVYLTYTVPTSGLGTFSADVNIIVPVGLTAYYCTTLKNYEDGKQGIRVSKLNGGIIPANTGVLFEGPGGQSFPLFATTVEATAPAGNSLVAVVESQHIAATDGDYTNFMMKGGKFIKIQQDDEGVKMPANRAYLPLLTSAISGSNAKEIMLYWDDEETTGVERMRNVENEIMRNRSIYNLNGQRLSAPQKGINIVNGRKVIVK